MNYEYNTTLFFSLHVLKLIEKKLIKHDMIEKKLKKNKQKKHYICQIHLGYPLNLYRNNNVENIVVFLA